MFKEYRLLLQYYLLQIMVHSVILHYYYNKSFDDFQSFGTAGALDEINILPC